MSSAVHPDRRPPYELWHQAETEHPDDVAARRIRYIELMREHGHIVPTLPGQSRNLPCGCPGNRETCAHGLAWGECEECV